MKKIFIGKIHADYVTMPEAVDAIISVAEQKCGGIVLTPNVDHIVLAEKNESLRDAYHNAFLSLADGKPLVWMSRVAGHPLPEKVSGSDIVRPLLRKAAEKGLRVYFLGAAPGVGIRAAEILCAEISGLKVVGVDSPPTGFHDDPEKEAETLAKMQAVNPDIVLAALGAPKQEILIDKWYREGVSAVMLGVGASLDFISGKVKRAPGWMSAAGLEWLYRLSQDPVRLAHRYLVRDLAIISIFVRFMRTPPGERVQSARLHEFY